jgi:hypothetical protein
MEYLDSDIGHRESGDVAVVTLHGTESNVMLIEHHEMPTYRSGRGGYRYHGGHYKRSPARLAVPHAGHWHVVVDMGGFGGQVRASVEVLSRHAA